MIRTKIIATLGPASANRERLCEMLDVGLDICRLNFSHGTHASHAATLELVRTVATERNKPVCVIGDLCGPKIRLGSFADGAVMIEAGQTVRFVRGDAACTAERLTVSWPSLIDELAEGQRVYIDDGLVRLLVTGSAADEVVCTCTTGGALSSHKGVNLPDTTLSTPALTEKDRIDLAWAIDHELDYVALSFVRHPEDLYELKRLIKARGSDIKVVIKIEKTQALDHLDELIANTDAVLVARGDLGVETDIWRVPLIQKDLISRCRDAGVPVIVATQMLQSMVDSPIPTRAEVSDVANAIFDRADAVMLSAESAVGKYPGLAVDMMNRIADTTESYLATLPPVDRPCGVGGFTRPTLAVAHAAVRAALDLNVRLVAVWTATGATVRQIAQHRLPMPVVGLAYDEHVLRQMNLLYGVIPVRVEPVDHPRQMAAALEARLLDESDGKVSRLAAEGDLVIVVTSTRTHAPGGTDTVLVHRVGAGT